MKAIRTMFNFSCESDTKYKKKKKKSVYVYVFYFIHIGLFDINHIFPAIHCCIYICYDK